MNQPQDDQVSRNLNPTGIEVDRPDDGVSPLMVFPTSYVLTREQEKELVDHAMRRLEQLETETGRDACGTGDWWSADGIQVNDPEGADGPQTTWMGKRTLYDKTYKNEMDWRPALLGGIFAESNLIVPAARRICRQMIARGVNYFFGTSPWFSLYPVGALDKAKADKGDRYARWKMNQAKLQRTGETAIERAFIVGEATVKTSWAQKESIYKTTGTVLVDAAGADILGADGDYIFNTDLWIQDSAPDPATGEIVTSPLQVLKRDGVTPLPATPIWVSKLITRRISHYRGPESKVVHFMDFLCPLDAPSVQDADCVVHLYDMPLMSLADRWKKSAEAAATAEERVEATTKATELLRRLSFGGGQPSGQNSNAVDSATRAESMKSKTEIKVAEFNITYDIDGAGLRNITLVLDRTSRTPIFYDYDANVTADGLRPYSIVRVNEIPGRWYGLGAMEMMNPSQQIIDLWMNRKNRSVSGSGRVDFWRPEATEEGRANPNLELNWGGTYTPVGTTPIDDILKSVHLEDQIGDDLMEMIQFFMQLMMNESGIANANDGNVAGMDSTKLATGVRNVEKSGQELYSLFLGHLDPGITDMLLKAIKLLFSRLDELEVHRYFEQGEEGGEGAVELTINPAEISLLEIDVQVLMTRSRGEQVIESNVRGIELVEKFFSYPYEMQVKVAAKYIEMAKEYQWHDADKIFIPTQILTPPGAGLDASGLVSAAGSPPRQSPANL